MPGSTHITASGVVGTSGKPVRVYGFTVEAKNSGQGVVRLFNGTADTDTENDSFVGTPDLVTSKTYGDRGKYFPAGLYVSIDSDVNYVDIDWEHPVVA